MTVRRTIRQNKAFKSISAKRQKQWDKFLGCVGMREKDEPLVLIELDCYQKHLRRKS